MCKDANLNELFTKAIRLADTYLKSSGGKYGPFIEGRSINPQTDSFWEVEFAHFGEIGRNETYDPESILLMADTAFWSVWTSKDGPRLYFEVADW